MFRLFAGGYVCSFVGVLTGHFFCMYNKLLASYFFLLFKTRSSPDPNPTIRKTRTITSREIRVEMLEYIGVKIDC